MHQMGVRSLLRPAGLLVLTLVLVFQFVAPVATASASTGHGQAHAAQNDCEMMMEIDVLTADAHPNHDENAAHCMPSMCCFHDTFVSIKLASVGLLLPSSVLIAQGTALSSHADTKEDRPPKHA
jgi:hypothetical protein